jgi:hypothetical protein
MSTLNLESIYLHAVIEISYLARLRLSIIALRIVGFSTLEALDPLLKILPFHSLTNKIYIFNLYFRFLS